MKTEIILCFLTLSIILSGCGTVTGNAVLEDTISIPLSEISEDMNLMEYQANGVNVRYFIVLGSDGEVRTAFDACDVCGGNKGYAQNGDDVVCKNCGRVFSIDDLGSKNRGGGCWPSYLPHQIQGNNVIIQKSDLEAGAFRFA